MKICPNCKRYIPEKSERLSFEEEMKRTIRYMVKMPSPIFTGLKDIHVNDIEIELRTMIKKGYVDQKADGFYWTEKGKKFAES